ncbi:unnamed protein product [Psylliodes chrysocephalus]|uniref:Uncharacterized protein n=1 Tax=Psylliodes chrysocephalus TaxID=3402493 RepID=A0A9P0GL04_9CUCU|nr:unnamed protein product [Psylliodes chrysocephala]
MSSRCCKNRPDDFCYICRHFTVKRFKRNITDFVKNAYFAYFKVRLGDQDKPWTPHVICKICEEALRHWFEGTRKAPPFGIPMVWREPKNQIDDCYFCLCDIKGHNTKSLKYINDPNLSSEIRPVPHDADIPVPVPHKVLQPIESESSTDLEIYIFEPSTSGTREPQPFSQVELNDLVTDLGLPKDLSEVLGSRLKEKKLLAPVTTFYWYRNREAEFVNYFAAAGSLVNCQNVSDLVIHLGAPEYNPAEWTLFIDSSNAGLCYSSSFSLPAHGLPLPKA